MKKVSSLLLAILVFTSTFLSAAAQVSATDRYKEAEKLVQLAEQYAGSLKWEISLEYRKTKYSLDPITYPNMTLFNQTKNAMINAENVVNSLPYFQREALWKRLQDNVTIHFTRTQAYIDAITSGSKIIDKTEDFYTLYGLNAADDKTELAYHDLSSEIRKQAILLYRVYGKSTRDAILEKYKTPGEIARDATKFAISTKIEIDELSRLLDNNANTTTIENQASTIKNLLSSIENTQVQSNLNNRFASVYTNSTLPTLPTLTLKDIIKFEKSVVMIYSYDENDELLAQGSGFVAGKSLLTTNYHVIEGAQRVEVITDTGEIIEVEGVTHYDYDLDIAFLKTKEVMNLTPLSLGTAANLEKGDSIVTIGSPEGLMNTVSTGIISGLRDFEFDGFSQRFLQFTAPITYGSSGGPLFTMTGEVVGINTFGYGDGNLNFAIPIDEIKSIITDINKLTHTSIKVIPYSDLPVYQEEYPIEEDLPATEEPGAVDVGKLYLNDLVRDSVIHPELPIIYYLNENKDVVELNFETGEEQRITFGLMPERLYLANNELYVTLLKGAHSSTWWDESQEGAIAIIDTASFLLVEQFDIDMDPFDIVADAKSIYVTSGSGQWTYMKSYDRETLLETSKVGVRQQSYLELHPNNDKLYTITTDSSPRNMEMFKIVDGVFAGGARSPYHGDYSQTPFYKISPDGKFIFNGAGPVFYSSDSTETNMYYVTSLYNGFTEIAFNLENNQFFTSTNNSLDIYDYSTMQRVKRYEMDNDIYRMFYRNNKLIVISKETVYNIPQFTVTAYDIVGNEIQ
ncbi:trypsin-like peptidase domain-containing protein [Cytobacillus suaedae]|nr:trypsin-like peptidase domain-containing protein [Cytobacillus suaedae]